MGEVRGAGRFPAPSLCPDFEGIREGRRGPSPREGEEQQLPLVLNISQVHSLKSTLNSERISDIFSVIESSDEHPEAQAYILKIQKEYKDVLYEAVLAKDVDPEVRGPFG